jgi:hypothetical protein
MKYLNLILAAAIALAFGTPVLAKHSHSGPSGPRSGIGGPPSGRGSGGEMSGSHGDSGDVAHTDMSHGSPSEVLSHNPAIGGKIQTLTGQDSQTACSGFKNIGQCVAAAHVAKNLDIPGGFDALKMKMTGSGAVSLGKAIEQLAPSTDAKAESKKANKEASDDLRESSS